MHSGIWRHWTLWAWFVLAMVLCIGCVALWKSGRWLISEDSFDKVRWGVVLAGESRDCERSDAAIRMYQDGKIDTLVISATRIYKTRFGSEFMVDYYVQQGVPRERVFEFRQDTYSTIEEARQLIRQFRLQNLDTALIVTTSFHTARTRRIFRKLAQGYPVILVSSADYAVFDPNAFWSNRESLKLWFDEWMKTFFTVFELAKAPPENGKAEYQGLTPDIWAVNASGSLESEPASAGPDSAAEGTDTLGTPQSTGDGTDSSAAGAVVTGTASDSGQVGPRTFLAGGTGDSKAEPKPIERDTLRFKADSIKAHKDSVKAYKDSVKVKAAEAKAAVKDSLKRVADAKAPEGKSSESKSSAKDTEVKKSLPRSTKKAPASKTTVKPADKKLEKTVIKKKN
jgi:uncharacterized SAM-binding protein YcdF (DUF218 family)